MWSYRGHSVKLPTEPDHWLNLTTGRSIGIHHPSVSTGYSLRKVPVLGSISELGHFWVDNLTQLSSLFPSGTSFDSLVYQPFSDIRERSIAAAAVCEKGTAGSVLFTSTTDVEQLSSSQLQSLCLFTFGGVRAKARVVHVIDGDTLDIVLYVPLVILLSRGIVLGERNHGGFFARIRIRMYGYDAVEHTHPNGPLATQLLQQKLASLNNIVWVELISDDKYGRTLGVLWGDSYRGKDLINEYLINEGTRRGVLLAVPYQGGTKILPPK